MGGEQTRQTGAPMWPLWHTVVALSLSSMWPRAVQGRDATLLPAFSRSVPSDHGPRVTSRRSFSVERALAGMALSVGQCVGNSATRTLVLGQTWPIYPISQANSEAWTLRLVDEQVALPGKLIEKPDPRTCSRPHEPNLPLDVI